jgi:UDP-N-acetylglucosamine 2-epimerase (non-hydrolysing)
MKIISVVAARPNFIKVAPFIRAMNNCSSTKIEHVLVHTGQHYDAKMSDSIFEDLEIPKPNYNLEIGSGSHAQQVGQTMIAFEKVLELEKPDWVVVFGDVNATMACTITAKKLNIKVCHIEAGIRSGDLKMPEEINRIVTDSIADLLLTPDEISVKNLLKEGKNSTNISFVGNIMIDSMDFHLEKAKAKNLKGIIENNLVFDKKLASSDENKLVAITLHRPSNVDNEEKLKKFVSWLVQQNTGFSFFWTIHPRTLKMLHKFELLEDLKNSKHIFLLNPLSYLDLLCLNTKVQCMITDSGGLQEECCVLGTPFMVLRNNTERASTIKENDGIGYLIGDSFDNLDKFFTLISKEKRNPHRPKHWDGKTGERCLEAILKQNA